MIERSESAQAGSCMCDSQTEPRCFFGVSVNEIYKLSRLQLGLEFEFEDQELLDTWSGRIGSLVQAVPG
jgi:hypothetical protein